ncbi:transcriptional regulator [Mycobacteroides abscessus]|uniref:transcriptional regulator n=1 Tax=Mycobacteroides abscessus TaxID=36809 RepID=UPI00188E5653|nr:transcriptional regulator [Mycobacteroides abscessus]
MPHGDDADQDSFADRLNRLFAERTSKTGVELSLSQFISDFRDQTGVTLSKGYLSELRNGVAPDPRLDLVRAFSRYFNVDPSDFRVDSPARAEEIAARGELIDGRQAAGATELGFRADGLSASSMRHIAQIINSVRSLEGLPPID